jgi:hypothetical protein
MTIEIPLLPLYNLLQLRFLLRNLKRFHHENLVIILKHRNNSWLVMSSVTKYRMPLSYVLKCSYLIRVNEENERDKLLITLNLMSHVALTFPIIVPYVNFMHHTAQVLTPLVSRMCWASTKLTFLLPSTKARTMHPPWIGFCFIIFTLCHDCALKYRSLMKP